MVYLSKRGLLGIIIITCFLLSWEDRGFARGRPSAAFLFDSRSDLGSFLFGAYSWSLACGLGKHFFLLFTSTLLLLICLLFV